MQERARAFGERLHALREERGWSLRDAAKFLGVAFTRIGEYERGLDGHTAKPIVPPFKLVKTMARVYRVPEEELLRLAGYGAGVDLDDDELELVHGFRRLSKKDRGLLLTCLRDLDQSSPAPDGESTGAETPPG